jgi:hypothetical protein
VRDELEYDTSLDMFLLGGISRMNTPGSLFLESAENVLEL